MELKPPLPKEEITLLIRRYKKGDKAAGDAVIEHNLRYAHRFASGYAKSTKHLTVDDLFQEAVIGMKIALDRFRFNRDACFLTYAKCWMRQKVLRAIGNHEHLIRTPINQQGKKGEHSRQKYYTENSRRLVYLDCKAVDENNDEFERGSAHQAIPDEATAFDDRESISHINYLIKTGLRELSPRERDIIKRRFGLIGGEEPKKLSDIGERYGLCRERIRQIEVIALRKMREALKEKAA
jgi:RNA polymerase sigma factor (sigma-70 family)